MPPRFLITHPGVSDFYLDVSKGNVRNHAAINIAAKDESIGTSIATIGNETGLLQAYSTVADIDSISSENAADVHDITIIGLDINYEPVVQVVTLNGQTRVALPTPLLRVNHVINNTTTQTLGNIWVYVNGPTTGGKPNNLVDIRSSIQKTGGISNEIDTNSVYTTRNNNSEGFVVFGKTTVSDAKALELSFWARTNPGVFKMIHHIDIKDNSYDYFFKLPSKIPPKTDIEVRAEVDVGTARVSAVYDLIIVTEGA